MPIAPFHIAIPDTDVQDLRERLARTRWPSPIHNEGWGDGPDATFLHQLVSYWKDEYDWRSREAQLNQYAHYSAEVDGYTVHFVRAEGKGAVRVPLLLLQGWPSSFVQVLPVLPLLTEARTDGTPSFDVIAASLPGYPFTSFPKAPGMSFARIAQLMTRLMVEELGIPRFVARGSDQGALVQQQMALQSPQHLIGIHRSGITPFASPLPSDLTAEELRYQQEVAHWAHHETAYARLQSTRPESLTPALADSPVGLAAWWLDKFQRWGDCADGVDACFGRDALLDNISLHWFTGAGAASIRLYREAVRDPGLSGRVRVPTAILMPLHDGVTVPAPREWAERTYDVHRWTVMKTGGHFPEWEVPHLVANDIRAFVASLSS